MLYKINLIEASKSRRMTSCLVVWFIHLVLFCVLFRQKLGKHGIQAAPFFTLGLSRKDHLMLGQSRQKIFYLGQMSPVPLVIPKNGHLILLIDV